MESEQSEQQQSSMKKRDILLVYGYIRDEMKSININIPKAVIDLFVTWYHNPLYIIKTANGVDLNDDTTIATQRSGYTTSYGSILMSSMDNMIYEYVIKIINHSGGVAIGIEQDGYKRLNSWFIQQSQTIHYGVQFWDGMKSSNINNLEDYAKRISEKKGAIIKMRYDVKKQTLSFIIDDKDYGIAFNNV